MAGQGAWSDGRAAWKNSEGRYFAVDTEEEARGLGYVPATQEEVAAREAERAREERYGGTSQQVLAAAEEFTRAASFGMVPTLDGDEEGARARNAILEKRSPVAAAGASFAGELAVDVAATTAAVATGGAAAGAIGAAKLASLGAKGARAVKLGTGLVGDMAAGAAYEASNAWEEQRDTNLVKAMAMGGIGGGLARGGMSVATRAARGTRDAISRALKQPEKKGVSKAVERAAKVNGENAHAVAALEPEPKNTEWLRKQVDYSEEILETASSRAGKALNDIADATKEIRFAKHKPEKVSGLIADNRKVQIASVEAEIVEMGAWVDGLERDALAKGFKPMKNVVKDMRRDLDAIALEMATAPNKSARHTAAENLKRQVGRWQAKIEARAVGVNKQAYTELLEAHVRPGYERLRVWLESEANWGPAALYQQRLNKAIHETIAPMNYTEKSLADTIDYGGHGRDRVVRFDPKSVESYLKGSHVGDSNTGVSLARSLKGLEEITKISKEFGTLPAEQVAKAERAAKQLREGMAMAENNKAARTAFKDLPKPKQQDPEGLKVLVKAVVEQIPGGGLVTKLGRMSEMVGTVGRAWDKMSRSAATRALGRAGTKAAGPSGALGAMAQFSDGYESPEAAFASKARNLRQMAADPFAMGDQVTEDWGDILETDPQAFAMVSQRMGQAVQTLAAALPPQIGMSLLNPEGYPPSRDTIRQYAEIHAVLEQTDLMLDYVADMRATPAQMKVFEAMYPELYSQLVTDVLDEVARSNEPVPADRKAYLASLMGLGDALGPVYSGELAGAVMAQTEEPEGSPGAPAATGETSAPAPAGLQALQQGATMGG